ncbi:MAG: hypothetical protein K2H19_09630, partial [Ruminococcus sp.]|nr:hypothetical protein [Ruminococcus sp.]
LTYNPLPPYIAEVAVPKNLWADGDAIWEEVDTPAGEIKSRFTRCAESISTGVQYGKQPFDSEAIITSVSELENYFQPYYVMLTTGKCVTVEVASQEVIDDYLARYNENFFKNNVLLLNYLHDVNKYEFESIQYEDSALVIKYYDATPYGLTWNQPLPPYIAEVEVPKTLWKDSDVIWEEVDQPLETTIKTDFTNEITDSAITSSYSKPAVITSPEELDAYLDSKFHSGVKMSLKDTYNNEFFENNVLILDLYYQQYHEGWETSLSVEKDNYNNIVLTYDRTLIDGWVDYGMQINQVIIPKEQYHFTDVLKEKTWETPVDVSYVNFDLHQIVEMNQWNYEAVKSYTKEGEWINSTEEMNTYLTECMSDEMIEFLSPSFSSIDWDKKSLYIWIDSDVIGSSHRLINSAETDDKINLTLSSNQPLSCMGGSFLHMITTNKSESGKSVSINNINMNDGMPHTDGESVILQFGYDTVMVNQYTFGNKNVADIYRMHIGGGPAMWSGYDYIGTVEFAEDYFPVKRDSAYISYAEGEKIVMETGEYKITIEGEQLTISYKYSADSEYTEQTFDY